MSMNIANPTRSQDRSLLGLEWTDGGRGSAAAHTFHKKRLSPRYARASMIWLIAALCVIVRPITAQTSVVSGASYQSVVAPGSIASLFGSNFSTETIVGTQGANGNYPKQLGGITVTVGGAAADVFLVSPSQVNFVVPMVAQYGSLNVVVASGAQTVATATATVSPTAPAIFTTDASGKGFGAILNGIDFSQPPFTLTTLTSSGVQTNTIVAVYGTGFRFSGGTPVSTQPDDVSSHVTAVASNSSGKTWNLPVLYAGPAPGYEGLDQVNVQVVPDVDTTSDINLTLFADAVPSNPVYLWLQHSPALKVDSVSPTSASPGASITISGIGFLDATNFQSLERETVVMVLPDGTRVPAPVINMQPQSASLTVPAYVTSGGTIFYYGSAQICVSVDSQTSCLPGPFSIVSPPPTGQAVGARLMTFAQNVVAESIAAISSSADPSIVATITASAQEKLDSLQEIITAAIAGHPQTVQIPSLTGQNVSLVIDLPTIQRTESVLTAGSSLNSSPTDMLGPAASAFERLGRVSSAQRSAMLAPRIIPDEQGLESAKNKDDALRQAEQAISTAGLYSFLVAASAGCAAGLATLPEGLIVSCLEGAAQITGLLAGFDTVLTIADYSTLGTLAVIESQPIFLQSLQVSPSMLTLSPNAPSAQFQTWGTVVPRSATGTDLVKAIADDAAASLVARFFGGGSCGACPSIPEDVFNGFVESVGSYLAGLIGQHLLSNESDIGIPNLIVSSAATIPLGSATLSTYAVPEQQAPFDVASVPPDAWIATLDASSSATSGAVSVRADKGNILLLNETIPTAHLGVALNSAPPTISPDNSSYQSATQRQ